MKYWRTKMRLIHFYLTLNKIFETSWTHTIFRSFSGRVQASVDTKEADLQAQHQQSWCSDGSQNEADEQLVSTPAVWYPQQQSGQSARQFFFFYSSGTPLPCLSFQFYFTSSPNRQQFFLSKSVISSIINSFSLSLRSPHFPSIPVISIFSRLNFNFIVCQFRWNG